MNKPTQLSPLPRDPRKIDADRLNLPGSFRFVGGGRRQMNSF